MRPQGNDSGEINGKAVDALLRGLPVTRMLDYGVARTDALALHDAVSSVDDWVARAVALADDRLSFARNAMARREIMSAAQEFEWRAALLNVAQIAFNADSPEKEGIYRSATESWLKAGELSGEFQGLTYEMSGAHAYAFALPVSRPLGCALVWGGLSGWGLSYLTLARSLARRSVSTLLVELPGQGLSRISSGLFLDAAHLEPLQVLIESARRFGPHVGVMGNSFGGLVAARFAAQFPTEIAACCVNGARPEMPLPEFRTPREQMCAASGLPEEDLPGWLERFAFRPAQHTLRCPVLIVEGGDDPLVPLGAQAAFITNAASHRTLTWATGEHTIYNFASERNALVAAWFADTFNKSSDQHAQRQL